MQTATKYNSVAKLVVGNLTVLIWLYFNIYCCCNFMFILHVVNLSVCREKCVDELNMSCCYQYSVIMGCHSNNVANLQPLLLSFMSE